jgi:hypothetical protein
MRSWKRRTRHLHKLRYQEGLNASNPNDKLSKWGVKRFGKKNVYPYQMWGSKIWRDIRNRYRKSDIKYINNFSRVINKSLALVNSDDDIIWF